MGKRILIEIGHPAHVHHFKFLYWELQKKGWTGLFATKDKECAIELLQAYDIPHHVLGENKSGIARKILSLPSFSLKMIKLAKKFQPDILVSRVSPLSGYASRFVRKPHITFTDTENVRLLDSISQPFADVILTSDVYLREHGKKQLRYPGYHELAYLHPKRFSPDKTILEKAGIDSSKKFAIVRFISWDAHHDIGHGGFSVEDKIKLVNELSQHLDVYISSESALPRQLESFRLNIKAEYMHHILAFAHMIIGEGATMAAEAAVLGTPAVFNHNTKFGLTNDLAAYGLIHQYSESQEDQQKSFQKAVEIAKNQEIKKQTAALRDKMLQDKIDVSAFMAWFVENYPSSIKKIKSDLSVFDIYKNNHRQEID